jgi:hypothetical protein
MRTLTLFAIALASLGCEPRKGEPRGLGSYRFGLTTRASIHEGICQPTQLNDGRQATWCFSLPPIKVGKRIAEVDAYFLGSEPPALAADATKEAKDARKVELEKLPLIEVQLKVRGCVETEAEQWMRERFGPQDTTQSKANKVVWQNSFLWAIAFLPSEPGRCLIHFLPKSEGAEIERLKQK